ncbi:class I SAM-dependent methyltransferase [Aestuariivivens sediminis]|uniref:class I SAM-dependent methyltransferase n=1 Tax=Aestuariivivens sediminis TaxID=2913557 RepID=UPI001F568A3A|nr:class I SAM-dependent methyltransferase [Aestuariivivens sediminis]
MKSSFLKEFKNPDRYRFEAVNCYYCNSDNYAFFLKGEEYLTGKEGEFQYVKCNNCEMVYQNPRISIDQIKEFYDGEYIAHRKKKNWGLLTPLYEWAMNKHDREKEKILIKHVALNEQTEILDVGCAVGTFLLHINKKYGVNISGVDFKEGLAYPDFDKIEFYEGLFYEQNIKEERYDVVTMWHFLEHCYDPNKSIQMAKKVLKKEGKLIIEVPRLDSATFRLFGRKWPGVQAPQHTVLYDKKAFVNMMRKNGFQVIKYLPWGAFPPYFYVFAGAYFKIIGKNLNLKYIIFPYFLGQLILTPLLWFQKYLNLSMQTVICEKMEV